VNWSKVCSPISKGGLGVRNLLPLNQALGKIVMALCFRDRGFVEAGCGL
jgi:hypothetical protein